VVSDTILVTGGTGTLGRVLVSKLLAAGRPVRVLSRRAQPDNPPTGLDWATGDLRTGAGIVEATRGVHTVVHCASSQRGDVPAAGRLIEAAWEAGVAHLIYISIVGIDRVPFGYYRSKLAVERLIEGAALPWTIQRTTQFHNLIATVLGASARLPVVPVPGGISVQPVAVSEVADRLAALVAHGPAGRVPDLGGPEVRTFPELARSYLNATGKRGPILPIRLPGKTFRAAAHGGLLTEQHRDGQTTFEQFLLDRFAG